MHKILLATLVLVCSGSSFAANTGTGPEVMLVGTFHMSNPGADLHNVKVDNMLAPQRQTEVETWAQARGRQAEIGRLMADGKAAVKKATLLQESTSVGNFLRHVNDPHEIALNHSVDPPLLTMGSGAEQPGVKLVSAWYTRNLAICARRLQTLAPGDHVLVFYGQEHVYLLRQCLSEQSGIKVVSSLDYLPADSGAHLTEVACVDVPAGEQRPDFGCFNVGTLRGLKFNLREVFWHLRRYQSVAAANAARSSRSIVVEEDGRVWLSEFAARDKPPQGGESVAVIGPMKLPAAKSYNAVLSYAVLRPGDSSRVHTHAGPEAWYVIEGEQCLETPAGKMTLHAGEGAAVDGDIPMELNVTGSAIRHAFALVIHDSSRPRGAPSLWKPPRTCGS